MVSFPAASSPRNFLALPARRSLQFPTLASLLLALALSLHPRGLHCLPATPPPPHLLFRFFLRAQWSPNPSRTTLPSSFARLLLQLSAAAATLLFLRISLEQRRGIIPFSCASTILLSIYFPPFFLPWCSLAHQEIPTAVDRLSPLSLSHSQYLALTPVSRLPSPVLPFPRTFFATSNLRLRRSPPRPVALSLSHLPLPPFLCHSCSFFRSDNHLAFTLASSFFFPLPSLLGVCRPFLSSCFQPPTRHPAHPLSFWPRYRARSVFLYRFLSFCRSCQAPFLSSSVGSYPNPFHRPPLSAVVIIKHCESQRQ